MLRAGEAAWMKPVHGDSGGCRLGWLWEQVCHAPVPMFLGSGTTTTFQAWGKRWMLKAEAGIRGWSWEKALLAVLFL